MSSQNLDKLLDAYSPAAVPDDLDWQDVLRRARPIRPRRRARRLTLAVVIALAVAAPALALSDGVRSLFGFERPEPVLEQARLLVSAPVGNGFYAHSWTSPSSTGGWCDFLTIDRQPVVRSALSRNGGGACTSNAGPSRPLEQASPAVPLNVGLSIARRPKHGVAANWVPPIIDGAVLPNLGATRVQVVWNGGSLPLRLRDSNFLGGSPALYMPPFRNFPYIVIAYNARGEEVARKRLQSPALMLMNGWKEYSREHKRWRQQGPVTDREWKTVISDWYDNGQFDHFHRCAAIRKAIQQLPDSGPSYLTAKDELSAYATQVC